MNLYPEMNNQIADILLLGSEKHNEFQHYAGHYIKQLQEEISTLKKALEMMYQGNKQYNPDGMGNPLWYIKQAQEEQNG